MIPLRVLKLRFIFHTHGYYMLGIACTLCRTADNPLRVLTVTVAVYIQHPPGVTSTLDRCYSKHLTISEH